MTKAHQAFQAWILDFR